MSKIAKKPNVKKALKRANGVYKITLLEENRVPIFSADGQVFVATVPFDFWTEL